jgi:uncharacterized membrane protein YfcA
MHPAAIAFVIAVILMAATAQTVAGFGLALIAMPLLITVMDVEDAIVVVSIAALLNTTLVARATWHHIPRRTVATLLIAAFAGMPLGLIALLFAPQDALRLAVAATSIVLAIALMAGVSFGGPGRPERPGAYIAGGIAGVLGTSTGMNGPPIVLYLQDRGLPPTPFRGALSSYFFVSGVVSMTLLAVSGVVALASVALGIAALPAVLAGNWTGSRFVGRFSDAAFRRLVLALLIATSLSAVGLTIARIAG